MRMVDENELRAGLDKMKAQLLPLAKKAGTQGCAARCQLAAGEAIHRWMVSEMDREAPPIEIVESLVAFTANAVASFFHNLHFAEGDSPQGAAEQFCTDLYLALLFRLDDKNLDANEQFYAKRVDGGRA